MGPYSGSARRATVIACLDANWCRETDRRGRHLVGRWLWRRLCTGHGPHTCRVLAGIACDLLLMPHTGREVTTGPFAPVFPGRAGLEERVVTTCAHRFAELHLGGVPELVSVVRTIGVRLCRGDNRLDSCPCLTTLLWENGPDLTVYLLRHALPTLPR